MSQCCKINKIVLFYIIEALVFDFKPYVIELKIQNKFGHFWCENCHEATLYSERYCFLFAKKKERQRKTFLKMTKKYLPGTQTKIWIRVKMRMIRCCSCGRSRSLTSWIKNATIICKEDRSFIVSRRWFESHSNNINPNPILFQT